MYGWVSIASHRSGTKNPCVVIAFALDIAQYLGVEHGSLVALQVGTGGDAGWLRLRPTTNSGGAPAHKSKGRALRLRIAGVSFGVRKLHTAVTRGQHEVFIDQDKDGRYVSFELPKWAVPSKHVLMATVQPNSSHQTARR